jgi:hypothetical protein
MNKSLKRVLVAVLVLSTTCAFAQQEVKGRENRDANNKIVRGPYLTNRFFDNISRTFNFSIKSALLYFIQNGYLPDEDCFLQLDERNERVENKSFLENYLNTELSLSGQVAGNFSVSYFDSACNKFVQIADVFSNLFYSHLQTGHYTDELELMKELGILKGVYELT